MIIMWVKWGFMRFIKFIQVLFGILLLLLVKDAFALVYFQTDFEEPGATVDSIFTSELSFIQGPGPIEISTVQSKSSSHSGHLHYEVSGGDVNGAFWYTFTSEQSEFYVRCYLRLGTYSGEVQKKLINIGGPNSGDHSAIDEFVKAWCDNVNGTSHTLQLADNNYGNEVRDLNATLEANTWYCLEFYVKLNTSGTADGNSNGIFTFWVDGVQTYTNSTIHYRNTPFTTGVKDVAFGYQLQPNGTEDRYYDDIVVSDAYTGPLGSGTTSSIMSGCALSGGTLQ